MLILFQLWDQKVPKKAAFKQCGNKYNSVNPVKKKRTANWDLLLLPYFCVAQPEVDAKTPQEINVI